jgi:hypothetical protein
MGFLPAWASFLFPNAGNGRASIPWLAKTVSDMESRIHMKRPLFFSTKTSSESAEQRRDAEQSHEAGMTWTHREAEKSASGGSPI